MYPHPLIGVSVIVYLLMLFVSVWIVLFVKTPFKRVLYLWMISIILAVSSILVRMYLITVSGYEIVYEENRIIVKELYRDEPYAPGFTTMLSVVALIPAVLSIPSAIEMLAGRLRF